MDKREAVNIAKKYVKLIRDKFDVEKVLLFGSFAKGNNHSDSDIDLAIIFT